MDLDVHLSAVAAGDARAFARFVAGAERPLRESLRSFATRVDVEAVLQEALLRAWSFAPRVELDGKPNAFLRVALRIARNLAIDEARRARTARAEDEDFGLAAVEAPSDHLLRAAIAECHEKLPPKPREALDARVVGVEHDRAIAARLGLKLNTFLQNFTRARKLLAECLRGRGIDLGEYA